MKIGGDVSRTPRYAHCSLRALSLDLPDSHI
jgi:hypothetical protein